MTKVHWIVIGIAGVVGIVLQVIGHGGNHGSLPAWRSFPGFDLIYGVVGCFLIIWGSKFFGKKVADRPENYWEKKK